MWTWDKMLQASAKLGVVLSRATVGGPADFEAAFSAIRQQRADALIIEPDPVNYLERTRICSFASAAALPSIGPSKLFVTAVVYQPLVPSVPAVTASAAGGPVLSSFTVTGVAVALRPAWLVHDPLNTVPFVSLVWC